MGTGRLLPWGLTQSQVHASAHWSPVFPSSVPPRLSKEKRQPGEVERRAAVDGKLERLPVAWRNRHPMNRSRSLMKPDKAAYVQEAPQTLGCCREELLKRSRGPFKSSLMLSKYFRSGYQLLCWQRGAHDRKPICDRLMERYGNMNDCNYSNGAENWVV